MILAIGKADFTDIRSGTMAQVYPSVRSSLKQESSGDLPPNDLWDKGKAPVERLEALEKGIQTLRKDVFDAMHKESISPQEISTTMKKIEDLTQAVKDTQPQFPAAVLPPKLEISKDEGVDTNLYVHLYNKGQIWAGHEYNDSLEILGKIEDKVDKSLNTPGSSEKEVEGWIFHTPIDQAVGETFDKLSEKTAGLKSFAQSVNEKGNSLVIEVESTCTKS